MLQSWDTHPDLLIPKPAHASLTPGWFLLMAFSSRLSKLSPSSLPPPFLSFCFFLSNLPFLFTCLMRSGDNLIRDCLLWEYIPWGMSAKADWACLPGDAGATAIAILVCFSPTSARQKGASSWMLTSRKPGYPSNLSWEPLSRAVVQCNFSPSTSSNFVLPG